MSVTQQQVLDSLSQVASPRGVPLTNANVLSAISVTDGKVFFSINVDAAEARAWESVRAQAEAAVRAIPGVTAAMIALTAERKPGLAATCRLRRIGMRIHILPACNRFPRTGRRKARRRRCRNRRRFRALPPSSRWPRARAASASRPPRSIWRSALRDLGLRVGLLDADIYGPSVPRLTGIHEKPQLNDDRKMIPIQRFGLAIMSIGFLVEEDTAMIWRGPMVMSAITQMLRDVAWGTLDILVVDMPPGTGDAQLTLAQNVPLKGAVIISTPQDLSLIDARRGLAMFKKVNVPVLGIVENMSYFQCPECGTRSDIFGHGGARHEAERLGVPFLGEIPLHMSIRTTSDDGNPVVASEPDGPHAAIYRAIGTKVRDQLQGAIAAA